jgi:hypothetical protein
VANTSKAPPGEDSLLFAEILEKATENKQTTCTMGLLLQSLKEIDRTGLEHAMEQPSITGTAIAAVLKRRGEQISSFTVQRHRRGACGCDRG